MAIDFSAKYRFANGVLLTISDTGRNGIMFTGSEGRIFVNHMGNFFDCIASREQPISDVESQHRSVSVCHVGNIAMRLARPLKWDPDREAFIEDDEANGLLRREQRSGYDVV